MNEKTPYKSLTFPFLVFFSVLLASVGLSYYFRFNTNKLTKNLFNKTTEGIVGIIEYKINEYKSCYYSAMPVIKNLYVLNNKSFVDLKNLEEPFCKTQNIILVEENPEKELTTVIKGNTNYLNSYLTSVRQNNKFKTMLSDAFKENSPKFFITNDSTNIFSISAIVPIQEENYKTYAFTTMSFEDIVSPVIKSDFLNSFMKLELRVTDGNEGNILYTYNTVAKEDTKQLAVKRRETSQVYKKSIDLSADHIHLSLTEVKGTDITSVIRNFSILTNIAGATLSIMFFIIIVYTTSGLATKTNK